MMLVICLLSIQEWVFICMLHSLHCNNFKPMRVVTDTLCEMNIFLLIESFYSSGSLGCFYNIAVQVSSFPLKNDPKSLVLHSSLSNLGRDSARAGYLD